MGNGMFGEMPWHQHAQHSIGVHGMHDSWPGIAREMRPRPSGGMAYERMSMYHQMRVEQELAAARAAQRADESASRSARAQEIARLEVERSYFMYM